MENMSLYERFRTVPEEAQKTIKGGRLRGFTDINPMWRIKVLTEVFGPVGIGWHYKIVRSWTEAAAQGEVAAFVEIHLFFKHNSEWSAPIPGIGGNTFIQSESSGMRTNDECFKMALTDALSVACKALGIGADVYFERDNSKYDKADSDTKPKESQLSKTSRSNLENHSDKFLSEAQCRRYYAIAHKAGFEKGEADGLVSQMFQKDNVSKLSKEEYDRICTGLENDPEKTLKWYRKKAS